MLSCLKITCDFVFFLYATTPLSVQKAKQTKAVKIDFKSPGRLKLFDELYLLKICQRCLFIVVSPAFKIIGKARPILRRFSVTISTGHHKQEMFLIEMSMFILIHA